MTFGCIRWWYTCFLLYPGANLFSDLLDGTFPESTIRRTQIPLVITGCCLELHGLSAEYHVCGESGGACIRIYPGCKLCKLRRLAGIGKCSNASNPAFDQSHTGGTNCENCPLHQSSAIIGAFHLGDYESVAVVGVLAFHDYAAGTILERCVFSFLLFAFFFLERGTCIFGWDGHRFSFLILCRCCQVSCCFGSLNWRHRHRCYLRQRKSVYARLL